MNPIILEVIKVGFHGAAIVMAYLTYRLLHKALDNNSKGEANLGQILSSVKLFMGLCLILFGAGITAQIFTSAPRQTIARVMVTPSPWPEELKNYEGLVLISRDSKKLEIIEGFAEIEVYEKDNIRVAVERLVNVLADLNEKNKALLKRVSPLGGFGE